MPKADRDFAKSVLSCFGPDSMAVRTMSPDELTDRFESLEQKTDGGNPRLIVIHTMLMIERQLDRVNPGRNLYDKIVTGLGELAPFKGDKLKGEGK